LYQTRQILQKTIYLLVNSCYFEMQSRLVNGHIEPSVHLQIAEREDGLLAPAQNLC